MAVDPPPLVGRTDGLGGARRPPRKDELLFQYPSLRGTDIADLWECEIPEFLTEFSPAGHAIGINIVLHAMTH